jgi:hypothetical protein
MKKTPKKPAAKKAAAPAAKPLTLLQAQAIVRGRNAAATPGPRRALKGAAGKPAPAAAPGPTPGKVGIERKRLQVERRREINRREKDYKAVMVLLKTRGVKGLAAAQPAGSRPRRAPAGAKVAPAAASGTGPLQIFAEGDSWFEYPVPFFGGGIIPRLEDRLGVPVLNLAKAGDEVRFMMGVEQRRELAKRFTKGCPAGGPWDVLLFSGGGNDIVDNPMALWVRDFRPAVPVADLIHKERYATALALVRAGYEDLIAMRDSLSPVTHLVLHAYDFAIPDGRGVCHLGPWLKPTFDLRGFPAGSVIRFEVVKAMLQQFAAMLKAIEQKHHDVTFLNAQGTLVPHPSSWHNELHPTRDGFKKFAAVFHQKLKQLFPSRVL